MKAEYRFLLAHHGYYDYDRCVCLRGLKCEVFVCARCMGVYMGLFSATMFAFVARVSLSDMNRLLLVMLLPAPAFLDWAFNIFRLSRGTNISRITSGFLLGIAYATLVTGLFKSISWAGLLPMIVVAVFWLGIYRLILARFAAGIGEQLRRKETPYGLYPDGGCRPGSANTVRLGSACYRRGESHGRCRDQR